MTVNQRVAGSSPASRAKGKAISNGCFFLWIFATNQRVAAVRRFDSSPASRAKLKD